MGMSKKEFNEMKIGVEEVEARRTPGKLRVHRPLRSAEQGLHEPASPAAYPAPAMAWEVAAHQEPQQEAPIKSGGFLPPPTAPGGGHRRAAPPRPPQDDRVPLLFFLPRVVEKLPPFVKVRSLLPVASPLVPAVGGDLHVIARDSRELQSVVLRVLWRGVHNAVRRRGPAILPS